MGLWTFLEGLLMLGNALAVLNEERFLAPRGWGFNQMGGVSSLKVQIIGLVHAVHYLRLPLIALNTIIAISMLISGTQALGARLASAADASRPTGSLLDALDTGYPLRARFRTLSLYSQLSLCLCEPLMQMSPSDSQLPQPASPANIMIKDLRPSAFNNINTVFILLEKGLTVRSENGTLMAVCLAADQSAAVHLQLWGMECDYFQSGDIVRLSRGIFSSYNGNMILRAGRKGKLEKIGEFTMVFSEFPNMSKVQWVQEPSNPAIWIPVGLYSPQVAKNSITGPSSSRKAP